MSIKTSLTQNLMTNRRYQFWALNLFGWGGYGGMVSLSAFLWGKDWLLQSFYAMFSTVTGLVISLLMRASFQRFWNLPPVSRGLYSLLVVGGATAFWAFAKMDAYFEVMGKNKGGQFLEFFGWYTYSFFILLSWAALYFGIKYYQMLLEERQRTLKARSMAHEAQLKMLRYQLNPHFLFNTLNAISTLILEGTTKTANTMVTELSKFLRYSLENDPMQRIDLAQELHALTLYLNIEKVRFEDRLRIDFDIEERASTGLIPSLLLQPLVENSIKYAVSKNEHGGSISVKAKVFADELLIELSDDGPGVPLVEGKLPDFGGVGLRNFKARLEEIYGANHSCSFSVGADSGLCGLTINIRIPFETAVKHGEEV